MTRPTRTNPLATMDDVGAAVIGGSGIPADNSVSTAKLQNGAVTVPKLGITGTADATTFARGDGTWAVPAGGGGTPGSNSITTAMLQNGSVTIPKIGATGTASASNFLRGDGTWALTGAAGGGTTLSVDGTAVGSYNLDTTVPNAGDVGAYSKAEVDALIAGVGGGGGGGVVRAISTATVATTVTLSTTTWTPITDLSITKTVASTSDLWKIELYLDLTANGANTSTIIVNLTVDGTGDPKNFPMLLNTNGLRLTTGMSWLVSGVAVGSRVFGIACYLTGTTTVMAYAIGTGTISMVQQAN